MPDIDIFKQPKPVLPIPVIEQQPKQAAVSGLDVLQVKQPAWLRTVEAQVPYKTQLDQTLRYTDPEIGYNPFDAELEYKYADAHPVLTFRNNVLKGGAKLLGTFGEAFATIPLAINAAANKDFSKLYDNDLTNGLQDWYDSLEVSLPTYKNKNQTEHPVLSWFSTDIFNNIGGAVNNLGFTAGAILGTIAEGAVITALTGGTGTLPAVGANLTRWFGKFGRAVAVSTESAAELGVLARQATQLAPEIVNLERGLLQTGRSLAATEQGVVRSIGTGIPNEFIAGANATRNATINTIDKSLNTLYGVTKITDAIRYNLSLLTSATAEGAFEANSVLRNTEQKAKDLFFEKNGYDATGKELKNIQTLSKEAANFTMGANMAILYASNRINWGSLFKPTKASTEAVIDGGLFRGYRKFTKGLDKETGLYNLIDKTPTSKLGKALMYLTSPTRHIQQSLVESLEEGTQFTVSEGATDYALRKFEGKNRGELADYIKSFNYGVNQTFNTNEGLENLVGGFVGGIFGGFMERGVNAAKGVKHIKAKERLEQQIAGLNEQTFKGVFEHNIETAAVQQSLGKDYTDALKAGDLFKAKNIKAEMLHNWVNGAVKTNSFDARLDEIEAAKNLKASDFTKMWGGLEYTEENRQEAISYLDKIQTKAKEVKKDIEKVDRLFRGNPFNAKTQPLDYKAHETWKEQLALNLGLSRNYQERSKQLQEDINRLLPGLDINQAIKLASKTGISEMLGKISTSIDNLAKLESEAATVSPELAKVHRDKKNKLQKLFSELQPQVLDKFEAKTFIPTLRKLYNLTSGISMEANNYVDQQKLLGQEGVIYIDAQEQEINDDEVVSIFEQLVDMNKLHDANYKVVYSYNSLLKPRGAKGYANYVKNIINKTNSSITVTDDGKIETIIDAEREAEEEAKFQTQYMPEEELSKEEKQAMNDIILKEAAGEQLTPDEEELLNKNPLYTEKKKTEAAIKEAKLKEKTGKEAKKPEQVIEKNYVEDESGFRKEVSPVELLNKLNSHEKVGKDANKNLFKAIFSKVNNFLNSKITAKLATSDYAAEKAQNANVKQTYTPITLFDTKGNKTGVSGIYKARYERNIEIYHNGEFIGLLKPADSLFLDENGTRTIYEMTEAEFSTVTGMPRTEYKGYMKELNAYKKAHDALLAELEVDKGVVDNATVLKYFPEIRVNTGNTIFNSGTNKEQDTLIKDLQYQPIGTALLSYKNEGGYRKATIVNERELIKNNPAYFNKLKAFINTEAFKTQIQKTEGRYVLALPVNGEYTLKSLLFSRPAEINEEYKKTLLSILGNNVGNELTAEEAEEINNNIANTFYIANADRSVKGTNFELTINEDGSLSLTIKNSEQKTAYNNTINIEKPVIKTYEDIITLLQKTINDQERLDRNLQKLNIVIKEDSIKFQILNDADVFSLKDVADKIKVATTPQVFENFSINLYPKGSTKGEGNTRLSSNSINIIDTPSDKIIDELHKLNTFQEKLEWLKKNNLISPITLGGKQYSVIDYNDRVMVFVKIGKYNIPFYISTGQAGKKNVVVGNWYATFGIGIERGWINKGSEEDINNQYNFPIFQKFAKILNEGIGNIESRENNNTGKLKDGIGFLDTSAANLEDFNKQMNLPTAPTGNNQNVSEFYAHVNSTLQVLNNELVNIAPKSTKQNTIKPQTAQEKQTLLEKVKNIKAGGRITNVDVTMAQADPEGFLEFIADQAYGVTTDSLGNKTLDGNGGNEASLIETFGAELVNGAKAMFPLEAQQPILPKTEAEIQIEKELAEQKLLTDKIENEYNIKKEKLHASFINNLTAAEQKIREFIKNNNTFVGKDVVDVEADIAKGAGVTTTDVINYVNNVKIYNSQRNKLNDILQSKKDSIVIGSTNQTIQARNVAETSIILQDLFNLPKDQADATASLYERNRLAWVERKYNNELEYRKKNKTGSSEYSLDISEKAITQIKNKIQDYKEQQELTNDSGRKMIIQAKIDEQETKLNNSSKQLYGADLLEYINKQSYERFSFGKISGQELSNQMLTQTTPTEDIIKILETNKIIDTNCK